jgi:N-acetylglucosaminyldiphosphoundecaprenol N-acetyl-beta-D-mannosaminyltransferase
VEKPKPPANAPEKARVLTTGISATSNDEVCRLLAEWGDAGTGEYVCVCNVHTVMEAKKNADFRRILNEAAIATPDGMPLVWTLRKLGFKGQERVYGPDLVLAFAKYSSGKKGLKSYFYGGEPDVARALADILTDRFPGFESAGAESPPFRKLTQEEDEAAVERINASGASVLWVGLGAPKQERWMAAHAGRIKPAMVGVGAAFDFLTGRTPQAPRWIRNCGMEWFFRLCTDPRRMYRRYIMNNPLFIVNIAKQLLFERREKE